MQEIEFKNVRGNAETATPIDKEVFVAAMSKLAPPPVGENIPSNWRPSGSYKMNTMQVEGVEIEHIYEAEKSGKVILYIHGGAYVFDIMDQTREMLVKYLSYAKGAEVYSVRYRLAPTNVYPAALEDGLKAYKWLLEQGYQSENIIIAGESAGGNLVLALTLYLKDHNLPLPKGEILISPWTDMASTSPSRTLNYTKDLIVGEAAPQAIKDEVAKSSYAGDADIKDPYVSPIYGDYKGFPDLLIQAGTFEVLYDDAVRLANKAEAAGVNVSFTSYYGMSHCFQYTFDIPETAAAWEEIGEFIKGCFKLE